MAKTYGPRELDKAFAYLIDLCPARCPVTSGPDASPILERGHVIALARAGRIRVEISGHNWRQIFFLTGPHAGKSTAPNPNEKARVYKTVDASGTKINGKFVEPYARIPKRKLIPRLRLARF